jgi:hypothetical protein
VYLLGWMAVLFMVCYLPTHLVLRKLFRPAQVAPAPGAEEVSAGVELRPA